MSEEVKEEAKEEEIPPEMQAYKDALVVPQGYRLMWTSLWGYFLVRDDDDSVYFRLTDRTFGDVHSKTRTSAFDVSDIDYLTGNTISSSIDEVIARKGHAVVLDVACGHLNKAAYQITETYGDAVTVKAVDIVGSEAGYRRNNLERVVADARALPFKDCSVDVVYSFQFLLYLPIEERKKVLDQILMVMDHNGHAVIDTLDTMMPTNHWLKAYFNPFPKPVRIHRSHCFFSGDDDEGDLMVLMNDFRDALFRPFSNSWTYVSQGNEYHFRPVTEFNEAPPGVVVFG